MGAKTSRHGPGPIPSAGKLSTRVRRLPGSRVRSSSMPDMPNSDVDFAQDGKDNKDRLFDKRASHDHVLASRKGTPPPDYHRDPDDIRQGYLNTADEMAKIWPSYQYLKQLDTTDADLEIVEKITQVFRHLLDQRDLIQTLSADNKRINGLLREYNCKEVQQGQRRRSQTTMGQLERRNTGDSPQNKATTLPGHRQSELVRNDPTLDPKLKLIAEVQKMRDQALISSSKRKSLEPQTSFDESSPGSPARQRREEQLRRLEELTLKVQSLQKELDQEKKKRPFISSTRDRSLSTQKDPEGLRDQICLGVKEEYARLDKFMMNELKAELDSTHKGLDDKTKYQFMCAIIQECKKNCEWFKEKLENNLKATLLHPFSKPGEKVEMQSSRTTSVIQNISKFESVGQIRKTDQIRQYIDDNKLPSGLHHDTMTFVATISDYVDMKPIVKEVIENLKQVYPTILTDSLCTNTNMRKFLTNCSKVAWNMCIIDPPMRLVSTSNVKFSEEYHFPFRSQNVQNAEVDYFLWPVLFDDYEKQDTVLGKGRVVLRKS